MSLEIDRRGLIVSTALGTVGAILALSGCSTQANAEPVAKTLAGDVRGKLIDGVNVFKAIPYGADTRANRFQPPTPPAPWAGVRDAFEFGNQSPQVEGNLDGLPAIYDSWANPTESSEDCLVLNVFTRGLRDGGKRPVMVWFHGGGYTAGSGSRLYADGVRLAQRDDVILVSVNHRLNVFGYLYLSHHLPELADSGNVGMLDCVLALQWVRDNIAEFGGDPDSVTIFGQSGGGGKVSTLMAMPDAAGLFHRAIVQSGSGITAITAAEAQANTDQFLEAAGLTPEQAAELATLPFEALIDALARTNIALGPVVDGRSLPRHPFEPDAPELSRDIPLLVGTTKDETNNQIGGRDESLFDMTWEELPGRLRTALATRGGFGGEDDQQAYVDHIVAELRRMRPEDSPSDIFFTATTEAAFRQRAYVQAERKVAQGGAPVFMYLFAWETPVADGKWKAGHSIDLGFVFDNVAASKSYYGEGENLQQIADTVSSAWVQFARTGDPGWAAYNTEERATMVFDVASRIIGDPRKAERVLFSHTSV